MKNSTETEKVPQGEGSVPARREWHAPQFSELGVTSTAATVLTHGDGAGSTKS